MSIIKVLAIAFIAITGAGFLAASEGNRTATRWLQRAQVVSGVGLLATMILRM